MYLGWRIGDERRDISQRIDAIIVGANPEELNLSPQRIEAILRVEDPTFWTNKGVDLTSPGAGMATLSQGLGKSIFFEGFKPGFAKIKLMALTRFALYPKVDQQRTLKAVLARVYLGTHLGRSVIGIADSASTWFGKPLSRLSDGAFRQLQAMFVAPNALKPGRDDAGRIARAVRIERLLSGRCAPTGLRDVRLAGWA